MFFAHALPRYWVTGSPWHCPIRITLTRDTGLLNRSAWSPVPEIVQLTPLTVLALGVVPAIVTHTSMCPLAGSKYSWVEVTCLRMPIAVTPLTFVGVLALCRSPGPVVIEGGTAFTVRASSVVLADTDIMDLHSRGGTCRGCRFWCTAVSVAMTEAAPLQTQLGNCKIGAGGMEAPLGHWGQLGEVDSQVCDVSQLLNFLTLSCWNPRC